MGGRSEGGSGARVGGDGGPERRGRTVRIRPGEEETDRSRADADRDGILFVLVLLTILVLTILAA